MSVYNKYSGKKAQQQEWKFQMIGEHQKWDRHN
jgi:hypothetical protein